MHMYKKLKKLEGDRKAKQTSSSLFERFVFWKREKHRMQCLDQLGIWNKRLGRIKEIVDNEPVANPSTDPNVPLSNRHSRKSWESLSGHLHRLSQQLYEVIAQFWTCCNVRHEARFRLDKVDVEKVRDETADFDCFIAPSASSPCHWAWQEAHIVIRAQQYVPAILPFLSFELIIYVARPQASMARTYRQYAMASYAIIIPTDYP